jgi:3-oxoacyl-[acyl-carrier protein] reductase
VFQADLADRGQAQGLVDAVVGEFGRSTCWSSMRHCSSAGCRGGYRRRRGTDVGVNVHGTVALTERVMPHITVGGRLINVHSVAGQRAAAPGFAHYGATEAAVAMYGRSWAHELAPRGITVNNVVVSFAQTDAVIPADSELTGWRAPACCSGGTPSPRRSP